MSAPPAIGAYRALLRLYPRRFRDEYGPDMALLFADQLRDEPAARVWVRGIVDLAITVPTRHLEAHMDRPPTPVVPLLFVVVSLTGMCVVFPCQRRVAVQQKHGSVSDSQRTSARSLHGDPRRDVSTGDLTASP